MSTCHGWPRSALGSRHALHESEEPGSPHAARKCFFMEHRNTTTAEVGASSRDRQIPAQVRERCDCNQAALHVAMVDTRESQHLADSGQLCVCRTESWIRSVRGVCGSPCVEWPVGSSPWASPPGMVSPVSGVSVLSFSTRLFQRKAFQGNTVSALKIEK